jgi:shikimate kinase
MPDFESSFISWLTDSLTDGLPAEVAAVVFNLYEPAGDPAVLFGIEMIGAERFDASSTDWACDEIWEPSERGVFIPVKYSGTEWEGCLAKMGVLLERVLSEKGVISETLKSTRAVGIGFVDGDLRLLWSRAA